MKHACGWRFLLRCATQPAATVVPAHDAWPIAMQRKVMQDRPIA
jgi:hypothetical protein